MTRQNKFNPTRGCYDWRSSKKASVEFLNQIKRSFNNNDRTFKEFLHIITGSIVKNRGEIDRVYEKVSEIFKDDPGLSIEFSRFSLDCYETEPSGTEEDGSELLGKICPNPSFRMKRKNPYEELIFKCEDDQFEVDVLLGRLRSILEHWEELLNDYVINPVGFNNSICIVDKYFSIIDLRTIQKLYGDSSDEILGHFRRDPVSVAQKVILPRVVQKIKEVVELRSEKRKMWRKVYSDNHRKAADHRSFCVEGKLDMHHEINGVQNIDSGKSDRDSFRNSSGSSSEQGKV